MRHAILYAHLAVFLFGCAGLFGKFIEADAGIIVLGRTFFAALLLWTISNFNQKNIQLNKSSNISILVINGVLLAFHWFAFFRSIQLSSVTIGVLTFSTFPVFTAFLEPLFEKQRPALKDLFLAAVSFVGIYFILPKINYEHNDSLGVLWGIASGFSFAIISILSKQLTAQHSSIQISFYQNFVAFLVVLPFFFNQIGEISIQTWLLLMALGFIFTGIAHTLFIQSLKGIKAKTASLIANLEPVYAIFLSILLLDETLSIKICIGAVLILGISALSSLIKE